jgi:hypothetical protein
MNPLAGGFAHPFVPPDLWQMPMTLDWDWADMTNGFGGSMEGVISNGMSPSNGGDGANGHGTSGI